MADTAGTIHLVHSDSDVLLALYEALSSAGFQVAASSNARAALAFVARTQPQAVLCRWEMQEMDPGEFLERAKKVCPASRIIVSSRLADGALYEEVLRRGGDDLLLEPFNLKAVVYAASRMLGIGVPYEFPPDFESLHSDMKQSESGGENP